MRWRRPPSLSENAGTVVIVISSIFGTRPGRRAAVGSGTGQPASDPAHWLSNRRCTWMMWSRSVYSIGL